MICEMLLGFLITFSLSGSVRASYSIDCTEDLCPYDNVIYTCMFTDNIFVKWNIDFGYKTSSVAFMIGLHENGTVFTYIEPFMFQFLVYSDFEGATTASFTVVPEINGSSMSCIDAPSTTSSTGTGCSISIQDFSPPHPPQNLNITVLSDTSVQLWWSPPSSHTANCLSQYTITTHSEEEGSITYVVAGFVTSTELTGFTVGVEYSISLAATDNIGRQGNSSHPVSFTLQYPTKLTMNVFTTEPTCLDDPVDILVTWSGEETYTTYNLYHNISGSVEKTAYSTTQEMLQGSQGKTYSFFVEAVNPVGIGPPSNLSIVTLPFLSLQGAVSFQDTVTVSIPTTSSTQSKHPTDFSQSPNEESTIQFTWYIILPTALMAAGVGALLTALLACLIVKMHHRKTRIKGNEGINKVKTFEEEETYKSDSMELYAH